MRIYLFLSINIENKMANEDKLELLLHPLRMRIITEMHAEMTAQEIAEAIPDVSQATLYRHINKLAEGGVLNVVKEIPVRGTVQKVYKVDVTQTELEPADIENLSKDEMLIFFNTWVSTLIGEFGRYLEWRGGTVDLNRDHTILSKVGFWASDGEVEGLYRMFREQCNILLENEPSEERQFYMWTTTMMPLPRGKKQPND